jgi:hypothetical protein
MRILDSLARQPLSDVAVVAVAWPIVAPSVAKGLVRAVVWVIERNTNVMAIMSISVKPMAAFVLLVGPPLLLLLTWYTRHRPR